MTMAETITLETNERIRNYAKIYSSLIDDLFQRKRAYASLTALYSLATLIEATGYNVQKSMTVFRNPDINATFEISDFYVNNWHIDVRVFVDGDAFTIPKIHYEYNIVPDFYAVVKVNKELNNCELAGFAYTSNMQKDDLDDKYYSVAGNNLISYEKFLNIVKIAKPLIFKPEEHEPFKESCLNLVDNNADKELKAKILKHIFECTECRTEFCCFTGFEMVNNHLKENPDVFEDQTLNIIGAQAVDDEDYIGKEESIYIGNDEQEESTTTQTDIPKDSTSENNEVQEYNEEEMSDKNNETVSDIIDELFDIEEEPVNIDEESDITDQESYIENDLNIIENNTANEEEINSLPEFEDDMKLLSDDDNFEEESIEEKEEEEEKDNNSEKYYQEETIEEDSNKDEDFSNSEEFLDATDKEENNLEELTTEDITSEKIDTDNASAETEIILNDNKVEQEKIIVDYDETGEPIYSYVNNVGSINESTDEESVNEPIQEDSLLDYQNTEEEISDFEEYDSQNDIENSNSTENNDIEEFEDDDKEIEYETIDTDDDQLDTSISEEKQDFDRDAEGEEDDDGNEDEDDDEDDDEFLEYSNKNQNSSKKFLLGALIVLILAISGSAYFLINMKKNSSSDIVDNVQSPTIPEQTISDLDNLFESTPSETDLISNNDQSASDQNIEKPVESEEIGEIEIPIPTQAEKVKEKVVNQPAPNVTKKESNPNDVNKVLADAFAQNNINPVTIKGVNWQCAPNLFADRVFKNYLQGLDKVLKMNLNKNILDTTQSPAFDSVTVNLAIDNDGNILRSQIANSSGSDQIDNIVLQSIKETLQTQKGQILNDSEQKADKYVLKVVIKL